MEDLSELCPSALIDLHTEEKRLTEKMEEELKYLQHEIAQIERERERSEEGELNEINKRLVKLKCDTHILRSKAKHEKKTVSETLLSNLNNILREKEKLRVQQDSIAEADKEMQEGSLKDLQNLLQNCQEKMNHGSLDDSFIDETLSKLMGELKKCNENLTQESAEITSKAQEIHDTNAEIQRLIDEATANATYIRRKTSVGTEILPEIMNPQGARRHSEVLPLALKKNKQTEQKH